MNKNEAYDNGVNDGWNNYLAEHYGHRSLKFSGYAGNPSEYEEGYNNGWKDAERIDRMRE